MNCRIVAKEASRFCILLALTLVFACKPSQPSGNAKTASEPASTATDVKTVAPLGALAEIREEMRAVKIPLGGNSYLTTIDPQSNEKVDKDGITNWTSPNAVFSVFFRTSKAGKLKLYLEYSLQPAVLVNDMSRLEATCLGKNFEVTLKAGGRMTHIGNIDVTDADTGYIRLDLQGMSKSADEFGKATNLLVEQSTYAPEAINYVGDFSFYWGRRGPSVHMGYPFPDDQQIEWFYNEVTVPVGYDPTGSYYMANGFGEGYFGIQVNSPTERRVLFSVWSPFETDDPQSIPDDHKIVLLKKGENVRTGEFGNEGSGGQSYMIYPWKTGNTYKFLTQVKPNGKGATIYTSYFYTPDEGKWMLIASFQRPQTNTYYKRAHSFLECFDPELGYKSRKVYFGNQWARTTGGKWINLTQGRFTNDATAKAKARFDYKGGTEGNRFFLQNGGFLNDYTPFGASFTRTGDTQPPKVNEVVKKAK